MELADSLSGTVEAERGEKEASPRADLEVHGEMLLLEAARSIVHDTRNRLTGLSLYLAAWRRNMESVRRISSCDLAVIEKSLGALEALCGEFSGVELAINAHDAPAPENIAAWYASYLARLGIRVSLSQTPGRFDLNRARRGVLSRTLIELTGVLFRFRATRASVGIEKNAGVSNFRIRFDASVTREKVARDRSVRSAGRLLESCGGRIEVGDCGDEVEITMLFPDLSYAALSR